MEDLLAPLQCIKGVGPKLASIFSKKGISTIEDALHFLPREHEDRRRIVPLRLLSPGQSYLVQGTVRSAQWSKGRGGRQFTAEIIDESQGRLWLHWFHAFASLAKDFQIDMTLILYGEVRWFKGRLQMAHPEYATADFSRFMRVVPVYPLPEGLTQNTVRKVVQAAAKLSVPQMQESLPEEIIIRLDLMNVRDALRTYHLPEQFPDPKTLTRARERLVFEEFFIFQIGLLLSRQKHTSSALKLTLSFESFISALPFTLTSDQRKVICEIEHDVRGDRPMRRLLQGDVGSGKTVVAFATIAMNEYQSALMVPTEMLALQHYRSAVRDFPDKRCVLLVQGTEKGVRLDIECGRADIIIGTHALFQQHIEFNQLGLVIVDEQHRFGVRQRIQLVQKAKGITPHVLMMTATPIPRTLSLTLYGDLDLSIVRGKPKNRQPVRTRIVYESQRAVLKELIKNRVRMNQQVYVIYPLVDHSDKLDLRSATEMHARMERAFPGFRIALVHGKMESREKERILGEFKENKVQILVSTTVVEVGIDIANATLMVIEHADRLGLSQLHQLRGRVGRGTLESECVLVTRFQNHRLECLRRSDDGFEIAEEDLRLRGPGEFLGTRQSGLGGFRIGNLVEDSPLLVKAHEEASKLLREDPTLCLPKNQRLRESIQTRWKDKIIHMKGG